ncbi:recombinase family protein [Cohnella terricola]|uniref:Recombinase family protein n=1 Tax=Cohnella terricola TaxID=1289167 RepID=A0A559JDK8_9BACL|nr:recombinase family protein [Cohnella terricola]TVX97958.1 recombinase family protein [Cohnella terricola]
MTRAAIYVRVSTMKDSQKDSPEHQVAACKHYAEDMGWEISEDIIYEDRESGTNIIDRQAIQQLVRDAQRGTFQVVIFAALSRFARDIGDSIELKRTMVDALKVRIISIDDHYDSNRDGEMLFSIIASINQSVSEQISRSSRRGKRESALKGNFTGSRAPYGYMREVRNGLKVLIPDEYQTNVVNTIFQLYTANKMGEKAIVAYLNDKGIPSPKNGVWGVTTVQRMLQNEAYIGKNRSSKYETKKVYTNVNDLSERKKVQVQRPKSEWRYANKVTTHQGIIDEQTFQLAQSLRLERGGGERGGIKQKINIFAGIMKCAHCGSAMVSMRSKSKKTDKDGREYRYLICSRRRRQGDAGCNNDLSLPYYPFRDELMDTLSETLHSITSAEQLLEKHKGLIQINHSDMESEMQKMQKRITDNRKYLFELRREKMSGNFHDEEQYNLEKGIYENEIIKCEKRLAELSEERRKKADLNELYEQVMELLDELLDMDFDSFDEMQFVLKKLLSDIKVDRSGDIQVITTFGLSLEELACEDKTEVSHK